MEIQWALVLFTVVSGAGAWLFAFSMLGSLLKKDAAPGKMETITAFVLVAVGGCMSVMHLSHVDRILEALNHPTSGIFIEAAMIGVLCVILAVYFVLLARNSSEKARTAVGVLGLLVGMVFTYACGSSYLMEARPAWQTVTLPLAYFGTAASAGAGLNLLLKAVQKRDEQAVSFAGLMAVVGGALGAVLAAAFCIAAGPYVAAADNGAVAWVVALFAALAAVVVCGAVALKQPKNALAMGAIALVAGVVAAIALRAAMWLIGTPFMDFFLMALESTRRGGRAPRGAAPICRIGSSFPTIAGIDRRGGLPAARKRKIAGCRRGGLLAARCRKLPTRETMRQAHCALAATWRGACDSPRRAASRPPLRSTSK